MKNIERLQFWCYKILPLVYDDSLSYYEVLCKVTSKLNEVVDNVNLIPDEMRNLINEGTIVQDAVNKYLTETDVIKNTVEKLFTDTDIVNNAVIEYLNNSTEIQDRVTNFVNNSGVVETKTADVLNNTDVINTKTIDVLENNTFEQIGNKTILNAIQQEQGKHIYLHTIRLINSIGQSTDESASSSISFWVYSADSNRISQNNDSDNTSLLYIVSFLTYIKEKFGENIICFGEFNSGMQNVSYQFYGGKIGSNLQSINTFICRRTSDGNSDVSNLDINLEAYQGGLDPTRWTRFEEQIVQII